MDFLNDLPLFVALAKKQSYTAAAIDLDVPVSTLSRRISALEKKVGVQLVNRTTRQVGLTPAGQDFYARCETILSDAQEAFDTLSDQDGAPKGLIRVSTRGDVYHGQYAEVFREFAVANPLVRFKVDFTDRETNGLIEGYDLVLGIGDVPDSNFVIRHLGIMHAHLYASPDFLRIHGTPTHPEDLKRTGCILRSGIGNVLTFKKGDELAQVSVNVAHSFGCVRACLDFVLAGLGVTMLVPEMATPYQQKGHLIPLLPDWEWQPVSSYIVMPSKRPPHRVRVLIDHLVSYFGNNRRYPEKTHMQVVVPVRRSGLEFR